MNPRILITAIVAIVFAGLGIWFSYQSMEASSSGDVLYASELAIVPSGEIKSLAAYRNKMLVVNFWATWCAPCVQEMPELSALQNELAAAQVQFIGIGIDSAGSMAAFAQKYQITYPLLVAGMSGTRLAGALGNQSGGLPFTVILNKSGEIVQTYRGRLDIDQLRRAILAML